MIDSKQIRTHSAVEWLHRIGSHISAGDTLDETLATTVNFACELVDCDLCFIYVREHTDLVLWVWKHSDLIAVDGRIPVGEGHTAFLAQHRVPIAVSLNNRAVNGCRLFPDWSANPGETFVSVPLQSRGKLLGMIDLKHHHPRPYSRREVNLLSTAGFLLGAEIGISRLQEQNSDLALELETRKLVERGSGILQRDLGLSADQACVALERQSRERRRPIQEIMRAIILADEVKRVARASRLLFRETRPEVTQL